MIAYFSAASVVYTQFRQLQLLHQLHKLRITVIFVKYFLPHGLLVSLSFYLCENLLKLLHAPPYDPPTYPPTSYATNSGTLRLNSLPANGGILRSAS